MSTASDRFARRLLVVGLALALVIPAGVLAGGQTFSDVPPSHKFFKAIEAVAAADVTHGCGDGSKYCPDGLVTRGQMAAFLSRLGALAAGAKPVVNADRLDGLDASDFLRSTRMRTGTVSFVAAVGTRILLDPSTGADVRLGSLRTIRILNPSTSQPLFLNGISSLGAGFAPEAESATVLPGEMATITYDAAGTAAGYVDVMLTLSGPSVGAVKVSHLTCTAAKTGDDTEGWVSCVVAG
jgi:hypothetical protein